jgi:biopolymer transport protein ExbD
MELNLTSMMDVVFQLIIFFILVTNFAAADLPDMEPPAPEHSKARMLENVITRVINIVPDLTHQGFAKYILIADKEIPIVRHAEVTSLLIEEKQRVPALQVSLRVDRRVRFDQVEPVMRAITAAGIAKINLVALVTPGE